jgi:hypothetical protein
MPAAVRQAKTRSPVARGFDTKADADADADADAKVEAEYEFKSAPDSY